MLSAASISFDWPEVARSRGSVHLSLKDTRGELMDDDVHPWRDDSRRMHRERGQILERAEEMRAGSSSGGRFPYRLYAHDDQHLFERMLVDGAACRHSIWHVSPRPLLRHASPVLPAELRGARTSVDVRCAMPGDALTRHPWLGLFLHRYSAVTVAPVPWRLVLLDRSRAVLPGPVVHEAPESYVVSGHPDVLDRADRLIERIQQVGRVLPSSRSSRLDDRRLAVLTLVCRGAADQEIARRLSVSTRLVEMDVRHLKRMCGAGSRAQLVALALTGLPSRSPAR